MAAFLHLAVMMAAATLERAAKFVTGCTFMQSKMATSAAIVCATAKLSRFNILPTFNIYEIVPYRKDPDGGPVGFPIARTGSDFPAGTKRDDVIDRLIAIVQDAARK